MPQKNRTPQPVLVAMSVLAGYQVLVAGSSLADFIGADVAGLLVLFGAATQAGVQFYVMVKVTQINDPAAEDEYDEHAGIDYEADPTP